MERGIIEFDERYRRLFKRYHVYCAIIVHLIQSRYRANFYRLQYRYDNDRLVWNQGITSFDLIDETIWERERERHLEEKRYHYRVDVRKKKKKETNLIYEKKKKEKEEWKRLL